jgi:alkylation response protein AidB-like acyl-CoA dehydrogenase
VDFSLGEAELAAAQLARTILEDHTTNEQLRALEHSGAPYDAELWEALARSDLLGLALPTEYGGSDLGFFALGLLLHEVGRTVAPVPAYAALALAALPLARFGDDALRSEWLPAIARGEIVLTAALHEFDTRDPLAPTTRARKERLTGVKTNVPYAEQAALVLVPASLADGTVALFAVDPGGPGVHLDAQATPDGRPHARVELTNAPAVARLAGEDAARWLVERATAARCMVQLGVAERALEMTAGYARERIQFDRPIGSFQAVHQRAADAYIWLEAMRLTAWEALWRLASEHPATDQVLVAKFVAAEAGAFTSVTCQHLHGGVGIDVDYPLHRYSKWAIQCEHELGSARHQLDRLGTLIAAHGIPAT